MAQAHMADKSFARLWRLVAISLMCASFFIIGAHSTLANTYGDSTYGSNRYSGNNSTTTEPTVPLSVTATAGDAQATITFSPPASNGGAAITAYTAISSPGDITASGASSPIIVTGLENGTSYTFVMTATNSVGISASSSPSNAIVPSEPVAPETSSSGRSGSTRRVVQTTTNVTASTPTPVTPESTPISVAPEPSTNSPEGSTPSQGSSPTVVISLFTRDLQAGSSGPDVKALQRFLNAQGFTVAQTGPGSAGSETDMFGPATRAALIQFQIENSITPAAGYFGPKTMALIASLGGSPTTPGTNSPAATPTDTPTSDESGSSGSPAGLSKNLQTGTRDQDVRILQTFLNANGFPVAQTGPGSAGSETDMFGAGTRAALTLFQEKNGIVPAVGYFGPKTRELVNSLLVDTTTSSSSETVPGETVSSPSAIDTPATPAESDPAITPVKEPSTFLRNLQTGDTGSDVKELQVFLNSKGFNVAESGPGSTGNETEKFGQGTREALVRYQEENAILPATGYFGQKTRAVLQTFGY